MPEVVLKSGAVTIHDSGNPDSDPLVFGAHPQWADGSDESGTLLHTARRPSGVRLYNDLGYARLEHLAINPASVTAIRAEMRASATSNPPLPPERPNPRASVALYSGTYSPTHPFTNTYVNEFESITSGSEIGSWHINDDGVIRDHTSPLGTLDGTVFAAASALTNGCMIEVRRLAEGEDTADHTLTVYELSVVVTYDAAGLPHLRRFPRSDRRAYPVKSQQASPRRGPGSYY